MAIEGVIVREDHWTNPGGQTLEALEQFLGERTGEVVRITDLVIITTVAQMMQLVFDFTPA